jgi:hypothetical protein
MPDSNERLTGVGILLAYNALMISAVSETANLVFVAGGDLTRCVWQTLQDARCISIGDFIEAGAAWSIAGFVCCSLACLLALMAMYRGSSQSWFASARAFRAMMTISLFSSLPLLVGALIGALAKTVKILGVFEFVNMFFR